MSLSMFGLQPPPRTDVFRAVSNAQQWSSRLKTERNLMAQIWRARPCVFLSKCARNALTACSWKSSHSYVTPSYACGYTEFLPVFASTVPSASTQYLWLKWPQARSCRKTSTFLAHWGTLFLCEFNEEGTSCSLPGNHRTRKEYVWFRATH